MSTDTVLVKKKTARRKNRFLRKLFRVLIVLVLILAIIAAAVYFYSQYTQTHYLIRFYQETSGKVSDNIRIAVVSDIHNREYGENNETLISDIRALKPDLILIPGDMVIREQDDYRPMLNLVSSLSGIAPCYGVLGNHESERIYYRDRDAGLKLLRNATEEVRIGNDVIQLIGVEGSAHGFEAYGGREFMDKTVIDDEIRFTWLVGRHACAYAGAINFIVCAIETGAGSVIQREYNTAIHTLQVLQGLETSEETHQAVVDVIDQFQEDFAKIEHLDEYMTEIREDMEQIGEAGDYADDSEAYAIGTRRGTEVESDDPAYQNNSKWYSDAAAASESAIRTLMLSGMLVHEDLVSTDIILSAEEETRYIYGELYSLMINSLPSTGIVDISFTSGTTPTGGFIIKPVTCIIIALPYPLPGNAL